MFRYPNSLRRAALFLLLAAASVFAQTPSVKNFGVVEQAVLYRGAQPSGDDLKSLAQFGVKTIIDLRDDESVRSERDTVQRLPGLNFVNVPLNGLRAPSDKQVKQVLAAIESSPKPVFVHCRRGRDRTGVIIAAYRISHDHWSNQQALQEARSYHISWMQLAMRMYIAHYRP